MELTTRVEHHSICKTGGRGSRVKKNVSSCARPGQDCCTQSVPFPVLWQRRQGCHSPHFTQHLCLMCYLLLCSWIKHWKSSVCVQVFSAQTFTHGEVIDSVALRHSKAHETGEECQHVTSGDYLYMAFLPLQIFISASQLLNHT